VIAQASESIQSGEISATVLVPGIVEAPLESVTILGCEVMVWVRVDHRAVP
jgi:hypothetical protein